MSYKIGDKIRCTGSIFFFTKDRYYTIIETYNNKLVVLDDICHRKFISYYYFESLTDKRNRIINEVL